MDLRASAPLPCGAATAKAELDTLDDYPAWLGIVERVSPAPPAPTDPGPAWWVDLGGGLGPVRLRKRVRMVRTIDEPLHVRYERAETDGSDHHVWVLDVRLSAGAGDGTDAVVALHYAGTLPPLVDRLLGAEISRAGARLRARLTTVG